MLLLSKKYKSLKEYFEYWLCPFLGSWGVQVLCSSFRFGFQFYFLLSPSFPGNRNSISAKYSPSVIPFTFTQSVVLNLNRNCLEQ